MKHITEYKDYKATFTLQAKMTQTVFFFTSLISHVLDDWEFMLTYNTYDSILTIWIARWNQHLSLFLFLVTPVP